MKKMIVFIGVNAWDIFYSFVQNTLSLNSFLIWLSCLFTLLIFFQNLFHIFISKQTGYFINWQFHKCNYHPFLWYAISSVFQLSFIWLLDPLSVIEQKYIYGVWVPIWVKAFDIFLHLTLYCLYSSERFITMHKLWYAFIFSKYVYRLFRQIKRYRL